LRVSQSEVSKCNTNGRDGFDIFKHDFDEARSSPKGKTSVEEKKINQKVDSDYGLVSGLFRFVQGRTDDDLLNQSTLEQFNQLIAKGP